MSLTYILTIGGQEIPDYANQDNKIEIIMKITPAIKVRKQSSSATIMIELDDDKKIVPITTKPLRIDSQMNYQSPASAITNFENPDSYIRFDPPKRRRPLKFNK